MNGMTMATFQIRSAVPVGGRELGTGGRWPEVGYRGGVEGGGEKEEREEGYFLSEDERSNSPRLQCFPPGMPLSSSSTAIFLPPSRFPEGMFGCQFPGLQPEATRKRYILCLTLVPINS